MDSSFEATLHSIEDRHWWYRGRRRILREMVSSLPLSYPAEILDAGCGSGRNLQELRSFGRLTGLDPSEASLHLARERKIGTICSGSIEALPFGDDSFDLVTALDVLEHVDDEIAMAELRRVVRRRGFLLVTVPAYPLLWSPHDVANHHRRRYTHQRLIRVATSAGWRVRRTTYFNSLLLLPAVAYRLSQKCRAVSTRAPSDLMVTPRALDRVLEQSFRVEAEVLKRGRRLPAGLSLLGVFSPT
jgi:SAM-dependent methyltransferase